ncbi:MAG: hypothetical protein EDM03_07150 [Porphyrobacter sp. IPPAS B-1204]|nr:MAG: hypothetical protein EDM03_07150 [Porphyrobacter sp. IPPAS B-1204]
MVEVMRRFDMGSAGFYPTVVHRKDRKTPIGDKWFCINFGNQKKAFVWQGSKKVYRLASGYDDVWVPQQPNDGDLVVEAAALEGPAMWIDPAIIDVIFVHGELRDALKAAGVARPFSFKKCKVI